MQTLIVRAHRAHPVLVGPVSGILDDAESSHKATFKRFTKLQARLKDSTALGQHRYSDFIPQEVRMHDKTAAVG